MPKRSPSMSENFAALLKLKSGEKINPMKKALLKNMGMLDKKYRITRKGLTYVVSVGMGISTRETLILSILFVHRKAQGETVRMPVDRDLLRRFAGHGIKDGQFNNVISSMRKKGFIDILGGGMYKLTDDGMQRSVKYSLELESIESDLFRPRTGSNI